jgi:hypothetical protein
LTARNTDRLTRATKAACALLVCALFVLVAALGSGSP